VALVGLHALVEQEGDDQQQQKRARDSPDDGPRKDGRGRFLPRRGGRRLALSISSSPRHRGPAIIHVPLAADIESRRLSRRRFILFFLFFLASGFASLVDEVVWLRIAMGRFGVGTPLVAIVLSVFMAGLALGSWLGGVLSRRAGLRTGPWALRLYAAAELCIGASALCVPALLDLGRALLTSGATAAWGSPRYHLAAGLCLVAALLPFCACMGATFPLGIAALRKARSPFGLLYAANVLGATLGTLAAAFVLVEMLGFALTLRAVACLNLAVAIAAFGLGFGRGTPPAADAAHTATAGKGREGARLLTMLFVTGLVSMAMEIVWVREFTPWLGTVVYAFATILALYLAATFAGALVYRLREADRGLPGLAWMVAGLAGLLPLVAVDPRWPLPAVDPGMPRVGDLLVGGTRVVLSLSLFCAVVGFLTPMLVDRFSSGDPERAGRAYAVNVLGCILGPLFAGFILLPAVGERAGIATLSLFLFALAALAMPLRRLAPMLCTALVLVSCALAATEDYTGLFPRYEVRRDYEATVIATDSRGPKELLVNGVGITSLTPITKVMVHLPLAFLDAPPKSVLVICFGMGTSFRSALSWDVPTTAAELVPSVPAFFGFYHADAPALLKSPNARIVIDDGRRFLERTSGSFDLITVDPPPPVEAAGSSLLYSREFYALARRRLRPGGLLQQWFPGGEARILEAVTRALTESFPHVRIFRSVEGWGFHFIASDAPIPHRSAAELAARLPPRAGNDLVEWFRGTGPEQVFDRLLAQEISPEAIFSAAPWSRTLTDDQPVNEYYFLRRVSSGP
jgi:spermidine synthase